ncbi:MAG: UvrD-helicase domain-containing protein [bacterium]
MKLSKKTEEKLKEEILQKAIEHIDYIVDAVKNYRKKVNLAISDIKIKLRNCDRAEERFVQENLLENCQNRVEELKHLQGSPYFVRCDCEFEGEDEVKKLYFGKFNFSEKNIYSWVSRASCIRFNNPGVFSYKSNKNVVKKGKLLRKDQFMIVDGKMVFMSTESWNRKRELVHQEYLMRHKTDFILPEIIEQMEKAQDEVIRAQPKGAILISGPAGSGKTTLALHRVAYLVQSPDTAQEFIAEKAIVFVQDESSKSYFSNLLPELGVKDVEIITFADWAIEILNFGKIGIKFISRLGESEKQKDLYEYRKNEAIKRIEREKDISYSSKNAYGLLKKIYSSQFSKELSNILERQEKDKLLDRFDLTALLKLYIKTHGSLLKEKVVYRELKNGNFKKERVEGQIKYSLIVIDEIQNYSEEQVEIFRACVEKSTNAIIYVGDLSQQTHLCTLRDWESLGEKFQNERKVVLQKVYRTTKEILEYMNSVGFNVIIPTGIKSGCQVEERIIANKKEEILQIKKIVKQKGKVMIGILAKQKDYLVDFKKEFNDANIKVMSINEAQGVEFDIVFLVGVNKELFIVDNKIESSLAFERKKINKDLIYVALTRAMNELYVYGKDSLKEVIKIQI